MTAGVLCLLLLLIAQLAFSIRQASPTADEADHIFAGYMSWKRKEFGLNPEHPPLVKMLATLPIIGMGLHVPDLQERFFKIEAFSDGRAFLAANDPDRLLFRTRMAAAFLTITLSMTFFSRNSLKVLGKGGCGTPIHYRLWSAETTV